MYNDTLSHDNPSWLQLFPLVISLVFHILHFWLQVWYVFKYKFEVSNFSWWITMLLNIREKNFWGIPPLKVWNINKISCVKYPLNFITIFDIMFVVRQNRIEIPKLQCWLFAINHNKHIPEFQLQYFHTVMQQICMKLLHWTARLIVYMDSTACGLWLISDSWMYYYPLPAMI